MACEIHLKVFDISKKRPECLFSLNLSLDARVSVGHTHAWNRVRSERHGGEKRGETVKGEQHAFPHEMAYASHNIGEKIQKRLQ